MKLLKNEIFNKKITKIVLAFELILAVLFSLLTFWFVDIGSISQVIVSKIASESNEITSLKYVLEWFVVIFGGLLGTPIIYYIFMDVIIVINTRFVKMVIKPKNI